MQEAEYDLFESISVSRRLSVAGSSAYAFSTRESLPVDQLVPQPVIRKLHEVVVGELHGVPAAHPAPWGGTPGEEGVIGSLPAMGSF
jgi:hypothetical protein